MSLTYQMTDAETALLKIVKEWIIAKIESGDAFSVLLATAHPDGHRMTAYVLDPAELAFEQIRQELKGELKSVTDYVFAYDAWLQQDDGPRPLLVFQMEHTGAPCSVQLGQLYDLDRPSPRAKPKVILRGELQPIGDSDAWLA